MPLIPQLPQQRRLSDMCKGQCLRHRKPRLTTKPVSWEGGPLCTAFWSFARSCSACCPCLASPDTTIIGGATRVIDADTLDVKGERVRLKGIDAQEGRQFCERASGTLYPCGQAAIRTLRERIGDGRVACSVHGEDLNAWLVSQGHALAYRSYSTQYVEQEEEAQAARRGVWAGAFVAPWNWRRGERLHARSSPADSPRSAGERDALALYDDNRNGRITCREARRHGIAPVPRDHPAYRYMRDGDNDGVVCE